jgi:hypothetical protein
MTGNLSRETYCQSFLFESSWTLMDTLEYCFLLNVTKAYSAGTQSINLVILCKFTQNNVKCKSNIT